MTYTVDVTNLSRYALNGVQAVLTLPADVDYTGDLNQDVTLQGRNNVVLTLGHLASGESRTIAVPVAFGEDLAPGTSLSATAVVRSSTAQPVNSNSVATLVTTFTGQ